MTASPPIIQGSAGGGARVLDPAATAGERPLNAPPTPPPADPPATGRTWVVIFAALALLLLAAGGWYYRSEARRLRQDTLEGIAAIGELKAAQIQLWRRERFKDAARMAGDPLVRKAVEERLRAADGRLPTDLPERLKIEQTTGGYADALLFAPEGKLLLAANDAPEPLSPATRRVIAAALAGREAALSDFFRRDDGRIQIDVAAAVRDAAGAPLAVTVLRSDAAAFLYPLIQSWPTPSPSAETFIVRREGDFVAWLNEARHQTNTALTLRQPLSRVEIPAVQAALGRRGAFEGVDYRGVKVLSDLRPIAGAPWFLVAKVDAAEIFAEARSRAGTIVLGTGLCILLAAGMAVILHRAAVTERMRRLNAELERRVRDRTAQLEAANRELEAFAYSVSHDLRAPLRGVNGYARMLQEDYADRLDAEGHRLIGVVCGEARRMGRLIDDLLAFSRLGRQPMERGRVDMAGLARDAAGDAAGEAATAAAAPPRLEFQPLPPARGDPAMLRQVWANLLGNAVKFSRRQAAPVVAVGGSRGDGENTYFVRDNGVGFDMAHAGKLFRVFQRLHSEDEFEGTGVGLALVQRIIHRHGGRVWAEGKPGAGATFYFTLPASEEGRGEGERPRSQNPAPFHRTIPVAGITPTRP